MKNSLFVLVALAMLSACKPGDIGGVTVVMPTPSPAPTQEASKLPNPFDPVIDEPDATIVDDSEPGIPEEYCIPNELRTGFATAIPTSGSALYTSLVYDGVTGREANPTCLMNRARISGNTMTIPCAVNINEGNFYGRTWQQKDRTWVKAAIENTAPDGISVSIVENVQSPLGFASDAALLGSNLVMVSIDQTKIDFKGVCQ